MFIILIFNFFYFGNKKMGKNNLAEKNANNVIENLDNDEVLKEFPESNFKI